MTTMVDGLGFEELGPSGIQASGTVTMHPYFLGSLTTIDQISGANIYSTGTLQGENVYGDTTVSGATIKGTSMNATTISGTTIRVDNEGVLHSTSIGSPTSVYGAKIQAGSGALSAGSVAWIVFPTAYAGVPTINVSNRTSLAYLQVAAGSINAGSAYVLGATASDAFSWVTVGI